MSEPIETIDLSSGLPEGARLLFVMDAETLERISRVVRYAHAHPVWHSGMLGDLELARTVDVQGYRCMYAVLRRDDGTLLKSLCIAALDSKGNVRADTLPDLQGAIAVAVFFLRSAPADWIAEIIPTLPGVGITEVITGEPQPRRYWS